MSRIELIHPAAEADAESARAWYEDESPTAAARFMAEFNRVADSIFEHPDRWPQAEPGTRRALLRKFPFAIYYIVDPDMVMILSVAHHKRRPGYWEGRDPRTKSKSK